MTTPSRQLFLGAAVAFGFAFLLAAIAQENPAAAPASLAAPAAQSPAAAPATATPPTPAAPVAPAAATATAPAPTTPPAVAPPLVNPPPPGAPTIEPAPTPDPAPPAKAAPAKKSRVRSIPRISVSPGGRHGDQVRVMGDNTVAAGTTVRGRLVTVMGDVTIDGTVERDVVTTLGNTVINGTVRGKVVSAIGDITIGPDARIEGDVLCKLGEISRAEGAVVVGKILTLGEGDHLDLDLPLGSWWRNGLSHGRPLAFGPELGWLWGVAAVSLAFYVLLALAFPGGVRRCGETLVRRPIMAIVASMLALLALPLLFLLLCVTIVGIPVALLFLPLGVVLAVMFGRAAVYALIGKLLLGERSHPALAIVVGGLIFLVLYYVPIAGLALWLGVAWIGFGAVVVTLFSSSGKKNNAAAPVAPVAPSAPPTPVAPAPVTAPVATPAMAAFVAPVSVAATPTTVPAAVPSPAFVTAPSIDAATMPAATLAPPALVGDIAADPNPSAANPPPFTSAPAPTPAPTFGATPVEPGFGTAPRVSPGFGASAAAATPPPPPPPFAPQGAPAGAANPPITSAAGLARAGFWIRMGALGIDFLIIMACFVWWAFPLVPPMLAAYAAWMWKARGTTIGGIVCGLQVVRLDDRPLDWPTAVVRALGCFLSFVTLGFGFIWVAFDEEKQSWHDKIAGTTVVLAPKRLSLV